MKIVVATIVKNEEDIVEYWIQYYGGLFGYENIYMIENYSDDSTYEICKKYIPKGIKLERKKDYKLKGTYMTTYKNNIKCDFFFPVDIDEFIVFYDSNKTSHSDKNVSYLNIIPYLNTLKKKNPNKILFKMDYIQPIRTNYKKTIQCFTKGTINRSMGKWAKTFFNNNGSSDYMKYIIDHGNHMPYNNIGWSDLYLIHFQKRSHDQYIKKIKANVSGLNYNVDLNSLKKMLKNNKNCDGHHHVRKYIQLLENANINHEPNVVSISNTHFSETPDYISLDLFLAYFN